MRLATTSIVCSVALLQACTVKDYTFLNISSITVSPSNPAVSIGATQQFTASGTLADGSTQDVSGAVTWSSSNPSVATIDGSGTANGLAEGSTTIQAHYGSVTGSTDLTIRSLIGLSSIVIAPASPPSLPVGETQQFTATGVYDDGSRVDLTRSVTWSSSNSAVASIDAVGSARGPAAGTTTIQASAAGINGTTQLRVVSLTSIAIDPPNPTIAVGGTLQFSATGTYSDGTTTRNLTNVVMWTSDSSAVATINASGLATGVGAGATIIRARSGTIEGTTPITVRALISITVNPSNPPPILVSDTQQYQAIGHFSSGPDADITQSVTWSSDTLTVATISNSPPTIGLARGVGAGTSTIRARSASVEGTASISVTGPTSIAVTPSNASIPSLGGTQQFTATGTFPGGPTRDLTTFVLWSSSMTNVATVNPSGRATGLDYGGTIIQAALGSVTGTAGLTVGLISLALTPAYPAIPAINGTQLFTATGTFVSGPQQNISPFVGWRSSVPVVATIDATGLATGRALGGTTIQAASGSITASTGLTVGLTSLALTPAYPAIPAINGTQQFNATGTFTDSAQRNVTPFVGWSSSATTVATIDAAGLATGRGLGGTTILAVSGAVTAATGLTVGLTSLAVTTPTGTTYPAIPAINGTQQFTATGTFIGGSQLNITPFVGWSSSAAAIATVDAMGLATGHALGGTTIQAASGTINGSTGLTVGLVSIAIMPLTATIHVISPPQTQQFTATGTFTSGPQQNITNFVAWSSSMPAVATINASGLATAVAVGTTMIGARSGTITQTAAATLTVVTP